MDDVAEHSLFWNWLTQQICHSLSLSPVNHLVTQEFAKPQFIFSKILERFCGCGFSY
jgi:hypothetical protein